ncbi:tetratricopeptide repeat protein [Terasakiella sp. A23]|uniref:tetratricopeptide repeat protein n=1 Tax=Terasakiella sp. FCG-A23 TaxID=3080561 RepID=UPI002953181F|nr:tetratricopeptide repeat protein [Terasakiella sp. A23]MDV7337966.1 tetratricopeptide repeat protein [Terasakiella sp. A23]
MFRLLSVLLALLLLHTSPVEANSARDLAERLEAKASNGDIKAAYKLGLFWSQGKKVDPDYFTAAEWFERSAEGGYTKGMLKIADMYEEGRGVDKNLSAALKWNKMAAQNGSKAAMVKLGAIHALQNNFKDSANWYMKAAIKGDVASMRELGNYYLNGSGVRFDLKQAFAWLELAIEKGDYKAKALQGKIVQKKGQGWADDLRRKVNMRMVPVAYWDER